jgi:hypothetical protein
MKPRKNFRTRPKKSGAKRTYRIKTQKKRLAAAGVDPKKLEHMTVVEIRSLLQRTARKKGPSKPVKKTAVKKTGSAPKAKKA